MASVRKREWVQDGKKKTAWVVDFKDERGKRSIKTHQSKKAADAFLHQVQQQLSAGTYVADGNTIRFEEAVAEWLKHCQKRAERKAGLSRASAVHYKVSINRAVSSLEGRLLTKIKLNDIQGAIDDLCDNGLSGSSVHHTLLALHSLFDFAIERKWLAQSPVITKKLILPPKRKVLAIPSKDELRNLLQKACERPRNATEHVRRGRIAAVSLMLFAGLRRGEIAALQWGDVDFARSIIRVRHSMCHYEGLKGTKTDAGIREVPLVLPVAEALRGLTGGGDATSAPDEFLFKSKTGRSMRGSDIYQRYWRPVLGAAGLLRNDGKPLYRLHDMRHAAASLLIEQQLSPLHIKTMMGHASVTTTLNVYGHLFPSDGAIKAAADQVAERLLATRLQQDSAPSKITQSVQ